MYCDEELTNDDDKDHALRRGEIRNVLITLFGTPEENRSLGDFQETYFLSGTLRGGVMY
jgi:hypothetical protein